MCVYLSVCVCMSVCRVDELYAFFIQWSPNIEADEEGFVVVSEDALACRSEANLSEPPLLRTTSFSKDWEVLHICYSIVTVSRRVLGPTLLVR